MEHVAKKRNADAESKPSSSSSNHSPPTLEYELEYDPSLSRKAQRTEQGGGSEENLLVDLVSSIDGATTRVSALVLAQSVVFEGLSWESSRTVELPAPTPVIAEACVFMEHKSRISGNVSQASSQADQIRPARTILSENSENPENYGAALKLADFLGLDDWTGLLAGGLVYEGCGRSDEEDEEEVLGAVAGEEEAEAADIDDTRLMMLRTCIHSLPEQLLGKLLVSRFDLPVDISDIEVILAAVVETDPSATTRSADLTWEQLQLCDGKYLMPAASGLFYRESGRTNHFDKGFFEKIVSQHQPDLTLEVSAILSLEDFLGGFLENMLAALGREDLELKTIGVVMEQLLSSLLEEGLCKHAVIASKKAAAKFQLSGDLDDAGLTLPNAALRAECEKSLLPDFATVYVVSVLEYLAAELVELAGNQSIDLSLEVQAKSIYFADLINAVYNDFELCKCFSPFVTVHRQPVCLGLTIWAGKERARRDAATEALKHTHAEARNKTLGKRRDPDYYDSDDSFEGCQLSREINANEWDVKCIELDRELWDAVKIGDLAAAQRAFAKGANPDLMNVPREWREDKESCVHRPFSKYDIVPCLSGSLEPNEDSMSDMSKYMPYENMPFITTLIIASARMDFPMVSWLCDVGCNVDMSQPFLSWDPKIYDSDCSVDYDSAGRVFRRCRFAFRFGGLTPLFACLAQSSGEPIARLLLSRGADPSVEYVAPWFEKDNEDYDDGDGHILPTEVRMQKCALEEAATLRLEKLLMQHGNTHVNKLGFGLEDPDEAVMTSYWPSVVHSGDVEWAKELLNKYHADPNWPRSIRGGLHDYECNRPAGATVLMIAISNRDLAMTKLLLDHGANANLAEFIHADFDITKGDSDFDLSSYFEGGFDDDKKATPLSVALAINNTDITELLIARGAACNPVLNADEPFMPLTRRLYSGGMLSTRPRSNGRYTGSARLSETTTSTRRGDLDEDFDDFPVSSYFRSAP